MLGAFCNYHFGELDWIFLVLDGAPCSTPLTPFAYHLCAFQSCNAQASLCSDQIPFSISYLRRQRYLQWSIRNHHKESHELGIMWLKPSSLSRRQDVERHVRIEGFDGGFLRPPAHHLHDLIGSWTHEPPATCIFIFKSYKSSSDVISPSPSSHHNWASFRRDGLVRCRPRVGI